MAEALVVIVTVFWMVVGWRAMRAHERLADAASLILREPVKLFDKKDE